MAMVIAKKAALAAMKSFAKSSAKKATKKTTKNSTEKLKSKQIPSSRDAKLRLSADGKTPTRTPERGQAAYKRKKAMDARGRTSNKKVAATQGYKQGNNSTDLLTTSRVKPQTANNNAKAVVAKKATQSKAVRSKLNTKIGGNSTTRLRGRNKRK